MEKIYMEDNKKDKRNLGDYFSSKAILGSLMVVAVMVVATVVFGFGRDSYAIDPNPDVDYKLPESFTTANVTETYISDTGFSVMPYFTTGNIRVFCLEHTVDFQGNTLYTKGDVISDYGLLYLMAQVAPNKSFTNSNSKELEGWMSQVAIWLYLYRLDDLANDGVLNENVQEFLESGKKNPNYISTEDLEKIKTSRGVIEESSTELNYYTLNGIAVGSPSSNDPYLYDTINSLVNKALENRTAPTNTLSINFNNQIAITEDNQYYQTSLVSVVASPSDNFNGYSLSIKSAPEGAFVVDANGQKIEDLTNLSASDKIYFRVPVKNVTENNKTIQFEVVGSFKSYEGNFYVAEGAQTITSVYTVNNNLSKGAEIQLNYTPSVPDTGMGAAQTVYFIGLIILLSGVGIIYANVKPAENK